MFEKENKKSQLVYIYNNAIILRVTVNLIKRKVCIKFRNRYLEKYNYSKKKKKIKRIIKGLGHKWKACTGGCMNHDKL